MRNGAPLWTDDQVKQLQKLAGKKTCTEIGKIVGRSKHSVKNKILSMDLPRYSATLKAQQAMAPAREPMIALYKNHNPKKPVGTSEVHTKLEWCPECRSPVSNWMEHRERMKCQKIK